MAEKFISTEEVPLGKLDFSFGNPRRISPKKRAELEASLELHGDFGSLVVDERYRVISGNQRAFLLAKKNRDAVVTCRVLHNYSEQEMRQINVASNTHAGEWDVDALAEWFGDVSMDVLSGEPKVTSVAQKNMQILAPLNHEQYDYVLIVCKTDDDYATVLRKLDLEDKKVMLTTNGKGTRKARAVFYDGQF